MGSPPAHLTLQSWFTSHTNGMACFNISALLSHWLGAALGKHGCESEVLVDSEHSSWTAVKHLPYKWEI